MLFIFPYIYIFKNYPFHSSNLTALWTEIVCIPYNSKSLKYTETFLYDLVHKFCEHSMCTQDIISTCVQVSIYTSGLFFIMHNYHIPINLGLPEPSCTQVHYC